MMNTKTYHCLRQDLDIHQWFPPVMSLERLSVSVTCKPEESSNLERGEKEDTFFGLNTAGKRFSFDS